MTAHRWRQAALTAHLVAAGLLVAGLWTEWLLWVGAAANIVGLAAGELWRARLRREP